MWKVPLVVTGETVVQLLLEVGQVWHLSPALTYCFRLKDFKGYTPAAACFLLRPAQNQMWA